MATAKKKQDDSADMTGCSDIDDDLDLRDEDCSPLTEGSLDFGSLKSV